MQIFPRSLNKLPLIAGAGATLGLIGVIFAIWYWFSPKYTQVGYQPRHCLDQTNCPEGTQPVPYSHQLHAGQLGLDCRYCHVNVERSAVAMVPPVQTCMNCHKAVKTDSPKLAPIRDAFESGKAIEWVRIHKLPEHAFFDHSVHVTAGVGCIECHGKIDTMREVRQEKPLSMGWCLECHRDVRDSVRCDEETTKDGKQVCKRDENGHETWRSSSEHIRPVSEITKMIETTELPDWKSHAEWKLPRHLNPPENCSGCHR